MTGLSTDQSAPKHPDPALPLALADYADRLLLGTGLEAADAVLIASGGQVDPPVELNGLASVLQAGWLAEDAT